MQDRQDEKKTHDGRCYTVHNVYVIYENVSRLALVRVAQLNQIGTAGEVHVVLASTSNTTTPSMLLLLLLQAELCGLAIKSCLNVALILIRGFSRR